MTPITKDVKGESVEADLARPKNRRPRTVTYQGKQTLETTTQGTPNSRTLYREVFKLQIDQCSTDESKPRVSALTLVTVLSVNEPSFQGEKVMINYLRLLSIAHLSGMRRWRRW